MCLIVDLVRGSGQIRLGTRHLDGFFCEPEQCCVDAGLTMRIFGGASDMGMSLEYGQREEVKTINRRTLRCISLRMIPTLRNNVNLSPLSGTEVLNVTDSLTIDQRYGVLYRVSSRPYNALHGGRTVVSLPHCHYGL